ncbi:RDD family protein [Mycolicibacterium mengxianglii]|uniref:RDD family protein n=1 Tax=Mycolicibacterium mengxianglii TaxID=2736649 RepID=UPI001E644456|nr:RDD family protein [Mycolicibacterium mengxianglii]
MTTVLDDTTDAHPEAPPAEGVAAGVTPALAGWWARVGAFAIDVLIGTLTVVTLALVAWSTEQRSWLWWVCVLTAGVVLLAVAVNRLLLPALTGWSLGRALLGLRVVRRDGAAAGPWLLLLRDLGHLLDTAAVFLGWLWPLWDSRNRTLADLLVGTEVHRTAQRPARAGAFTAIAVTATAVVAVTAAVLSYFVVYQTDLRVAQAREQLSVEGPKVVEGMLSYDTATLQADFERARGLVTDGYREQLVAQQEAISKSVAVANDYWTANSAVLTNTTDRGTMLLALQGQRGTPPQQRFITATVKVDFEKSGGQWRVNSLAVLARPKAEGPAQ